MSMSRVGILLLTLAAMSSAQLNQGRPVSAEELTKLDITILPDGSGLPSGSGSVATGAQVFAQKCQGCHGANGVSVADAIPNLAGQKAAYLENQLRALKSGTRRNPIMGPMADSASMQNAFDLPGAAPLPKKKSPSDTANPFRLP